MADEQKLWGRIPVKEAITFGGLLLAIGVAWGTSQTGISSNSTAAKENSKKITKLERKLENKMDRVENRLHNEIRENRRLILKLLQKR